MQAAEMEDVTVRIYVAHASNQGTKVDPKLNFVREELESIFNYSQYKLIQKTELTLAQNESKSFELTGGDRVFVRYLGIQGDRIHIRLHIKRGEELVLNTDFELVNGGQMIAGGPKYKEGVLILALHASY